MTKRPIDSRSATQRRKKSSERKISHNASQQASVDQVAKDALAELNDNPAEQGGEG
jgi:hypothetical protein